MILPQHAIDSLVHKMTITAKLPRDDARLVVEMAVHATTEAMETMHRICDTLENPIHVIAAIHMASQIMEAAAVKEREGVQQMAIDLLRKDRAQP
jgi:hypothetical protein